MHSTSSFPALPVSRQRLQGAGATRASNSRARTLSAAVSASAKVSNGPTWMRVRLPLGKRTSLLTTGSSASISLTKALRALLLSANKPTFTTKRPALQPVWRSSLRQHVAWRVPRGLIDPVPPRLHVPRSLQPLNVAVWALRRLFARTACLPLF